MELATHSVPEVQHCLEEGVVPGLVGVDAVGEVAADAASSNTHDDVELDGDGQKESCSR